MSVQPEVDAATATYHQDAAVEEQQEAETVNGGAAHWIHRSEAGSCDGCSTLLHSDGHKQATCE